MMKDEVKSSWKRLMGVESASNMDCRFRLNSHKMMFIINSEDYMYRWGTLTRAKEVRMSLKTIFPNSLTYKSIVLAAS